MEAKKSNREEKEKYKTLSSSSEIRNCTVAWQGVGHCVPLLCLPIAPPDVLHLASLRLYAIATNSLSFEHLSYRKFKFRFKFLKSPQLRMASAYLSKWCWRKECWRKKRSQSSSAETETIFCGDFSPNWCRTSRKCFVLDVCAVLCVLHHHIIVQHSIAGTYHIISYHILILVVT